MSLGEEVLKGLFAQMILAVDDSLDRFPDDVLPHRAAFRRRGYDHAVMATPAHDIFSGRYVRGWRGVWLAARRYPGLVVTQRRILDLAIRTALGDKGFRRLRSMVTTVTGGRSNATRHMAPRGIH